MPQNYICVTSHIYPMKHPITISFDAKVWIYILQRMLFRFLLIIIFAPVVGLNGSTNVQNDPKCKKVAHWWLLPNKTSNSHNIWYTDINPASLYKFSKFWKRLILLPAMGIKGPKNSPITHHQQYISNKISINHKLRYTGLNRHYLENFFVYLLVLIFSPAMGVDWSKNVLNDPNCKKCPK